MLRADEHDASVRINRLEMNGDMDMCTEQQSQLLIQLVAEKERRRRACAEYCRMKYHTDPEYVAKKAAYKKHRYATDTCYREALQAKMRDARARTAALSKASDDTRKSVSEMPPSIVTSNTRC